MMHLHISLMVSGVVRVQAATQIFMAQQPSQKMLQHGIKQL